MFYNKDLNAAIEDLSIEVWNRQFLVRAIELTLDVIA